MPIHKHLPHLSRTWINDPVYFITTCTYQRRPILINPHVTQVLVEDWTGALERYGWMVGRYVIMPDHVHFFCSYVSNMNDQLSFNLSKFMQQWKQWTSKRIFREIHDSSKKQIPPIWQKEFFDHLLRSEESYSQKWESVRQNPVRKKLIGRAEDWQWQGEIFDLVV